MVQDIRVQRTEHAIHQAFFAALEHRDFTQIAVADLIRHAEIGKATFYHHYVDKFDLAKHLIDQNFAPVAEMFATRLQAGTWAALMAPMPEAVAKAAPHLRLLAGINTDELAYRRRTDHILAGVFVTAMQQKQLILPHEKAVGQGLATTANNFFHDFVLSDGQHSEALLAAERHELQLALQQLFPAPKQP